MLSRQKTGQDRGLLNNRRTYQDVADGAGGMLACAGTSGRHNAMYGAAEPSRGMMRGAVMDSSVGGCAAAAARAGGGGPSDRWYANAIRSADPDAVQGSFEAQVSRQLGIMRDAGSIPKRGLTVAVDMHLICRYDRLVCAPVVKQTAVLSGLLSRQQKPRGRTPIDLFRFSLDSCLFLLGPVPGRGTFRLADFCSKL